MADIKKDLDFKRLVKLLDKLPPDRQRKFLKEMQLKAQKELGHREAYSPKEYALLTGVAEITVRRWLREGTLRGTKIGRRWLIPYAEIERIATGTPPPGNTDPRGAL